MMSLFLYWLPFTLLFPFRCRFPFRFPFPFLFRIPVSSFSDALFSLVPDILFDCSRVLQYAKIRTVLQSISSLGKIDYPKVQPSSSNNHSDLAFLTLRQELSENQKMKCFTCPIFRAAFDSCSSFFASKPHRNAYNAGYRKTYSFPIVLKYQLKNYCRANQRKFSGTGTRDEPLRTSAGEAKYTVAKSIKWFSLFLI